MNAEQILLSALSPTKNRVTDKFGMYREWGGNGWFPSSAYSPIHTGVDYSALPEENIVSPIDGEVWGELVPGSVGSMTMIRSKASKDFVFYLLHCNPTQSQWDLAFRGNVVTKHAGHGIGAPHLHLELAITEKLACSLNDGHFLEPIDWKEVMHARAEEAGLNPEEVYKRVKLTMRERGILEIGKNYVKVRTVPMYRMSRYLDIGIIGETYFVDPTVFIKDGETYGKEE